MALIINGQWLSQPCLCKEPSRKTQSCGQKSCRAVGGAGAGRGSGRGSPGPLPSAWPWAAPLAAPALDPLSQVGDLVRAPSSLLRVIPANQWQPRRWGRRDWVTARAQEPRTGPSDY